MKFVGPICRIGMIFQVRARSLAILYTALFLAFAPCAALQGADRNEPVRLSARSVELNEKTGVALYRGDVVLTQGAMRILADILEVHTRDRAIELVRAFGKPAKLSDVASDGRQVQVFANEVEYNAVRRTVSLRGNAQVQQDKNVIRGPRMHYDLNTRSFTAQADAQGDGRVTAVIYPDSSKEKKEDSPP